ncbi:MAG: hypothetical protein R3F14_20395, partial [Polyangiaceae bacterium]
TLLVAQKCTPFEDTAPGSTETAVEISPQDSLGTLACAGSAPEGQPSVASFDLLPQDGLPGLLGLPCTSPAFVQKYTGKPLAPGKQLTFFIDAHPAADAPVAWGASCTAKVEEGLTVRAACTPLSAEGSFHIDISSLLAGFGAECSGDLATYDTKLVSGGLSAQKLGLPCTTDLSLGPLTPGDYAATVSVRDTDGGVVFAFACTATVEPGRPAEATCNLQ